MTTDSPTGLPVASDETLAVQLTMDELLLRDLIEATDDFSGVLREVSHDALPQVSVRWVVESVSMASPLSLEVRPASVAATATSEDLTTLARTIRDGFQRVQTSASRPPHFGDAALVKARSLADRSVRAGAELRLLGHNGSAPVAPVEITSQFVANVDQILGQVVRAIGTVEGKLEAFNMHGPTAYFVVYDDLTGERVKCEFGNRIPIRLIGEAAVRRVAVHGEISYRRSGEIVRVKASSLEIFPEEADLPTADAVKGILNG